MNDTLAWLAVAPLAMGAGCLLAWKLTTMVRLPGDRRRRMR